MVFREKSSPLNHIVSDGYKSFWTGTVPWPFGNVRAPEMSWYIWPFWEFVVKGQRSCPGIPWNITSLVIWKLLSASLNWKNVIASFNFNYFRGTNKWRKGRRCCVLGCIPYLPLPSLTPCPYTQNRKWISDRKWCHVNLGQFDYIVIFIQEICPVCPILSMNN